MKLKKATVNKLITYLMVIGMFTAIYFLNEGGHLSRQLQKMLVPICINIILAISLNITVGFLGELTLGHAAFMSVGAYSGCLFSIAMKETLPMAARFPLAMLVGGLVAAVFGILVGVPVLRLRGDYLAIVTLAFGEIIRNVILNIDFFGGASGLKGTPRDSTFLIAAIVVLVTMFVAMNLQSSRHGRAIMSIRDNRIAAEATGVNVTKYKLMAFVTSAALAGMAGALFGLNFSSIAPDKFKFDTSILVLVFVVLGGIGNIRGSVIAAALLTVLPEVLREFGDYRMLIYAIVLIAVMLLGNAPIVRQVLDRIRPAKKEAAVKEGDAA